ncbi:MAG TPA: insulinase family protein, partial [Candidatus Omnitrophica bacterium]|nr:insulinase family protein [Candidatus Omnitrophota bacterium]
FSEIKNSKMPTKKHMVEPEQDGAKRIEIEKESEVEIIAIAYHIPNFQHKDQIPLSALSELLSSGKSSRLNSVLIDEKKLVNSIYAYNMENKDPGIYLFMAVCNPGVKAEEVEKELLKQIKIIKYEK